MTTRTIQVDYLARVEGEGGLTIRIRDGQVLAVELRIFEPPRLFEALLRGRRQEEAPDITARICGICPVAYLMSSCLAIEDALGIRVQGPLAELRRILYAGEWIESHCLHVFLLHLPDRLGQPDALALAKDHGALVRRGLRMKKAGNAIVALLGGREIHPINVRVGGFYRVPSRGELEPLLPELAWGREAAAETLRELAELPCPELERDYELVAVRHPTEYAPIGDRLVSNRGLELAFADFEQQVQESQVPYSNALHATLRGRGPYLCGPLARFNLNFDRLGSAAREAAFRAGLRPPVKNPFRSLQVRLVEVVQAFDDAVTRIERYLRPDRPFEAASPRAGVGFGCSEAPRGTLYHRYQVDEEGMIVTAQIIPPTSQNQRSIEDDLRAVAARLVALPKPEATRLAEQVVRNHDPCISCATHFLDLRVVHG